MNRDDLFCNLEYELREKRIDIINKISSENLTIKEILDLGLSDNLIDINNNRHDLGHKWFFGEDFGYHSASFGELNEKQLNCKLIYKNYNLDLGYTIIYFELANEEDKKYFLKENKDYE